MKTIEEMLAMLDGALETVDGLLQEQGSGEVAQEDAPVVADAPTGAAEPEGPPRRCAAVTKAGTRCKNKALSGSAFCWVHGGGE